MRKILILFLMFLVSSQVLASPTKVLVLKNVNPWGSNAVESTLSELGINYDIMTSDQFKQASLDELLNNYYMIIIESDQDQRFYDTIVQERWKLEEFVKRGRVLEIHACDHGWHGGRWRGPLPGGLEVVRRLSFYDYDLVNHRWLRSTYASHGYFVNVPDDAEILTVQSTNPWSPAQPDFTKPTTVKFRFGRGVIFATMETYEYSVKHTWGHYKRDWKNVLNTTISSNNNDAVNIAVPAKKRAPIPSGLVIISALLLVLVRWHLHRYR